MNQYDGLVVDKVKEQEEPKKEIQIDLEMASSINNCGDYSLED